MLLVARLSWSIGRLTGRRRRRSDWLLRFSLRPLRTRLVGPAAMAMLVVAMPTAILARAFVSPPWAPNFFEDHDFCGLSGLSGRVLCGGCCFSCLCRSVRGGNG